MHAIKYLILVMFFVLFKCADCMDEKHIVAKNKLCSSYYLFSNISSSSSIRSNKSYRENIKTYEKKIG